jgi:hypothetical protein
MFDLPPDQPAQSLWDDEGDLIESMDDVHPGDMVFISQMSPEVARRSADVPADEDVIHTASILAPDPAADSRKSPVRPPSAVRSRPPSTRDRSGTSGSMLLVIDAASGSSRQRRRRSGEGDSDRSNLYDAEQDATTYSQTGVSLRSLEKLLSYLPPGLGITASDLVSLCPGIVARLGSSADRCQTVAETVIYGCLEGLLGDLPAASNSVWDYANGLVDDATFGNAFSQFTRLKHVIVGPPKSGKSVFTRILADAVLARFLATGQYRKTLVFSLDLNDVADTMPYPLQFYKSIVDRTFEFVAAQRLDFIPFRESLVAYFHRLPSLEKLVALPQQFVLADAFRRAVPILTKLSESLFEAANTFRSLDIWLTNVVLFPRQVALAFGFGNVHFVIDHLDLADFELDPVAPFDSGQEAVTLIEHLKFMLSNDSFIISGSDEMHLLEALDLFTDDGVDIIDGIQIVTVADIDKGHNDRYLFKLRLEDVPNPWYLRLADCGGCSGFLTLWHHLAKGADRLKNEEKKDQNSRVSKELRLSLLRKVRELAKLVFRSPGEDGAVGPFANKVTTFEVMDTTTVIGSDEE